uniref:CCHC-type domain-containing protein n=1 Tax=Tanacetum cinerariifolium TaxID=118510 RepID=A0A699GX86_TANCI|nr:hypothetical protein [Tanacetum cinerariifolium]
MLTFRKSIGSFPALQLASRYHHIPLHLIYSSRYSSPGYAISNSLDDLLTATSTKPSRKRCRSSTSSLLTVSPVHGAVSPVRTDLSPRPKRIRDYDLMTDLEISSEDGYEPYVPREAGLGVDFKDSYEPYTDPDIDLDIQADIDECITYANAIRARGMDDKDVVETAAKEEELTILCTKMVLEEEDRVEIFIGGIPDNIQGNAIVVEPTRLQDDVRIANNLMDQNLKGYAVRNAETKRRLEEGPCTVRCGKYNKVGNLTRDYKTMISTTSTQRGQVVDQRVLTCFECGRQGHYKSDYPNLKNHNHGNRTRNKNGIGNARGKAYVLRGEDADPNSNTVTGTFLLNSHYVYVLFDSSADKSFVSNTFSTLLDVIPSTFDIFYVVELVDGRIAKTDTILRGCTQGLLGQSIPIVQPYHTQPDGVLKMLTSRKSIGSFPALQLASRYHHIPLHLIYSLRYSSPGYAISDYLDDLSTATSTKPSRKRCRSSTSSLLTVSHVHGAVSPVCADLSPRPKRISDYDLMTDLEISSEDGYEPYVPREAGLGVDFKDSYKPYTEPDIDSNIQADINECIAYADAIRARGMDDKDVVETAAKEEVES